MQKEKLKRIIDDFNQGIIQDNNSNYVSILIIENLLKKKRQEFIDKTNEFAAYLGNILKIKISNVYPGRLTRIKGTEKKYNIWAFGEVFEHWIEFYPTGTIKWRINDRHIIPKYIEELKENPKIQEFMNYIKQFTTDYEISMLGIATNLGLYADIFFDTNGKLSIVINDGDIRYFLAENKLPKEAFTRNFIYCKDCIADKRSIEFDNDDIKTFINEETIGKIYASIKIDISAFSEKFQREIRDAEIALKAKLNEEQAREVTQTKELQLKRIMRAYELIKEATELLKLAKSDFNLERIKLDNINSILFKNNGLPNNLGYIEFEDFFKNNMILRMLDLSNVDLANVNITGMDFSGTNIHINPQVIYNKDMSYVNATDVKFSPFFDSFNDVILDGVIINDYEANIDLSKVRSYNHDTHIMQETVRIVL